MSSIEKIEAELRGLGYEPFPITQGRTVVIQYSIPIGKYAGEEVFLGFSFQETGYPEYPPHWVHISPPYNDQLGGPIQTYTHQDNQGIVRDWLALSRPPGALWDNLSIKHMKFYLDFHISRFCNDLK